jgi:hypothetical protein
MRVTNLAEVAQENAGNAKQDLHLEKDIFLFFKCLDLDFLQLDNRLKVNIGGSFDLLLLYAMKISQRMKCPEK